MPPVCEAVPVDFELPTLLIGMSSFVYVSIRAEHPLLRASDVSSRPIHSVTEHTSKRQLRGKATLAMSPVIRPATILPVRRRNRAIPRQRPCVDPREVFMKTILKWGMLAISVVGVVFLIDRSSYILWDGNTTLDIVISVCDQQTGEPIPGAVIKIVADGKRELCEGEFIEGDDHFYHGSFLTDDTGKRRLHCPYIISCGAQSYLLLTNTYSLCMPYWTLNITAEGYRPSGSIEMPRRSDNRRKRSADLGGWELDFPVVLERDNKAAPSKVGE